MIEQFIKQTMSVWAEPPAQCWATGGCEDTQALIVVRRTEGNKRLDNLARRIRRSYNHA